MQGTPIDLEIAGFGSRLELIEVIAGYVHRRRHAIKTHSRQRADRVIGLRRLIGELRRRWGQLDPSARQAAIAISHLHPRRVDMLLERPAILRAASLDEVLALCGALGIDAGRHLTGEATVDLASEQVLGLRTAALEYDWDAGVTLDLLRDAQLELTKGGIRRLPLTTPADWIRFKESRQP